MPVKPIKESDYQQCCDEQEILLSLIKDTEKVKVEKVSSRLLHAYGRECVRKRYKSIYGRDTLALAEEYYNLRDIQRENLSFAAHSPQIYRVCLVENQDEGFDACILEDFIHGDTLEEILQEKEYDYQEYLTRRNDHNGKKLPVPSRGFSEEEVISYMLQLCTALDVLHKRLIVHRDIKPQNLMLTEDGNICKLIDFDISREYKENKAEDTVFSGTKGYCAPEQRGGGQSSPATDVYGIGVTMHIMLVGISEHVDITRGKDFCYVHNKIKYNGPLKEIILKCTKADPEQRYKDAAELKAALEKLSDSAVTALPKKQLKKKKPSRILLILLELAFFGTVLSSLGRIVTGNSIADATTSPDDVSITTAKTTFAPLEESSNQETPTGQDSSSKAKLRSDSINVSANESTTEKQTAPSELDENHTSDSSSKSNETLLASEKNDETFAFESSTEVLTSEETVTVPTEESLPSQLEETSEPVMHGPYKWHFEPVQYEPGTVIDLLDCSGEYYYITKTPDSNGQARYALCSESGVVINIDDYINDSDTIVPPARIAFNSQKKELYLIAGSLKIYLVSDREPFTLLYESEEATVTLEPSMYQDPFGWNCTYLSDGTLFCGIAGLYIDTDTWKVKRKIRYSYILPTKKGPYAGFKKDGDFALLDELGHPDDYERINGGGESIFSDGEKLFLYSYSPKIIWTPREENSPVYIRDVDLQRANFLQKTAYGFLYYDSDAMQITKIIID